MDSGAADVDLTAGAEGMLLRLGAWEVRIRGPRTLTQALQAVLAEVAIPEVGLPPLDVVISDTAQARGMLRGETAWTLTLPRYGRLATLLGYTVGTATSLLRGLLFVHAAAVEMKGRGYVLVGAPGAGKTAAAAVLVRDGAAYLSDEVGLIDPRTGALYPVAVPLAVKPWTARAVRLLPPVRQVWAEAGVKYLLPSRRAEGPTPLGAVILLDPTRPAVESAELPRAEMLLALSQQPSSFRQRPRLESAFAGFVRLLRTAQCLRVGSAVPSDAAAVIASLDGRRGHRSKDHGQ